MPYFAMLHKAKMTPGSWSIFTVDLNHYYLSQSLQLTKISPKN